MQPCELVGPGKPSGLRQQRVDRAERHGVDTDPDGQGEDRQRRESGVVPDRTAGVTQIARKSRHEITDPRSPITTQFVRSPAPEEGSGWSEAVGGTVPARARWEAADRASGPGPGAGEADS